MKKTIILTISLLVMILPSGFSQTVNQPNYALKSHETLDILKIEVTPVNTLVFFTIENRIADGTFCADRNIFMIEPDGMKMKVVKASGIPVCPNNYKFKGIGEKLQFKLEFPTLKPGIKWIDIVEECGENCFSFYGVTLNSDLNSKINEALSVAEKGETGKAIIQYKAIIDSQDGTENGVIGGIYTDVIMLCIKAGDKAGAGELYKKLLSSKVPRLELYVKNLNSRGIKF